MNSDENKETITTKIKQIIPELKESTIKHAYRIGKEGANKTRPIKIELDNEECKTLFFQRKKILKEKNIFINDDITEYRREILNCANKLKLNKKINNCWIYKSCVFISINDERLMINNKEQLNKY